jgi:hypothetical protein
MSGSLFQFGVNRFPVGSLVFQAPEIKPAHTVRAERFRNLNALCKDFILLFVTKSGTELVVLGLYCEGGAPSTLNNGLAMCDADRTL